MKVLLKLLLFTYLFYICISCKCKSWNEDAPAKDLIQDYKSILIAKITSSVTDMQTLTTTATAVVDKVYLSNIDLVKGEPIKIDTCYHPSCCGMRFENEKEYLLFFGDDNRVNTCSPSGLIENMSKRIENLNNYYNSSKYLVIGMLILIFTLLL